MNTNINNKVRKITAILILSAFCITQLGWSSPIYKEGRNLRKEAVTQTGDDTADAIGKAMKDKDMPRRDFLKVTGLGIAGLSVFGPSPLPAQPTAFNGRIQGITSSSFLEDGLKFLDHQRVTGQGRVIPVNIPPNVFQNYRRARGKDFQGFNFNGLCYSYVSDQNNSHWDEGAKYLASYGRVHIYDASLAVIADLAAGRIEQASQAVNALIELAKDEEALGFTGGWHFSYNTRGDSWLDPRGPMGGNLWAIKAFYEYIRVALKIKDPRFPQEARQHLAWVNNLVKRLVFQMQVMDEEDPRYGLIRAMKYNSLLDVINPASNRPFTLDEIGYRAYEGNQNKDSGHIIFEHNADCVDVYRLAAFATKEAHVQDESFIKELARRHELLLNGIWEKAWVGDHFVTAMNPDGTVNESVAIDNNTWLAQSFLPYDKNRAWDAIEYVWNNFRARGKYGASVEKVGDLVLEDAYEVYQRQHTGEPFSGNNFFDKNFTDPYVWVFDNERLKLEQMVQPEATFGYIHFLLEFAKVTKDAKRREEAFNRADALYKSMSTQLKSLYPGLGLPYATLFVMGYFNTLHAMAPTASGIITTKLMQGSPVGFIGVNPPEDFTFKGAVPGQAIAREETRPQVKPEPVSGPKDLKATVKRFTDLSITLQLQIPEGLKGKQLVAVPFVKTDVWYIEPYADNRAMFRVGTNGLVTVNTVERSPFKGGNTIERAVIILESAAVFSECMGLRPKKNFDEAAIKIFKIDDEGNVTEAERLAFNPVVDSVLLAGVYHGAAPVKVGPGTPAYLAAAKPLSEDVLFAALASPIIATAAANGNIDRREFIRKAVLGTAAAAVTPTLFLQQPVSAQTNIGSITATMSADEILSQMTQDEKVGSLVSSGFATPEQLAALQERNISCATLYPPNFTGTLDEVVQSIIKLQSGRAIPVALFVDAEGGRLQTGPSGQIRFPGNLALGQVAAGDLESGKRLTYEAYRCIGATLRPVGIYGSYCPVADNNTNPLNPVIDFRSFGENPAINAQLVTEAVKGLQSQGVAATVKHFPGHGDTGFDSHRGVPEVNYGIDVLEQHLLPFRTAVDAGVAAVMSAHIVVNALDATQPATLSSEILTRLLRGKGEVTINTKTKDDPGNIKEGQVKMQGLGFEGVVFSDALEMGLLFLSVREELIRRMEAAGQQFTPDQLKQFEDKPDTLIKARIAAGITDAEVERIVIQALGDITVRAINAGADVVITGADPKFLGDPWMKNFGIPYTEAAQFAGHQAIKQAVTQAGFETLGGKILKITPQRLDEANRRVLNMKLRFNMWEKPNLTTAKAVVGSTSHKNVAREVANRSIVLLKAYGPCLKPTDKVAVVYAPTKRMTPADDQWKDITGLDKALRNAGMQQVIGIDVKRPKQEDDETSIEAMVNNVLSRSRQSEVIIVATYFARQDPLAAELVNELARRSGKRIIMITLGSSYDPGAEADIGKTLADKVGTILIASSTSPATMEEAALKLMGKKPFNGRLANSIPGVAERGDGLTVFPESFVVKGNHVTEFTSNFITLEFEKIPKNLQGQELDAIAFTLREDPDNKDGKLAWSRARNENFRAAFSIRGDKVTLGASDKCSYKGPGVHGRAVMIVKGSEFNDFIKIYRKKAELGFVNQATDDAVNSGMVLAIFIIQDDGRTIMVKDLPAAARAAGDDTPTATPPAVSGMNGAEIGVSVEEDVKEIQRLMAEGNKEVYFYTPMANLLLSPEMLKLPAAKLQANEELLKENVADVARHDRENQVYVYVDKGAIRVSYKPQEAAAPAETQVSVIAAAKGTVLVVDDNPAVLGVTKTMLEHGDYTVIIAENAEEALQKVSEVHDITLIVSDKDMPGMSGVELSNKVGNIPFLLITGSIEPRPTSLRSDAGFLPKPFGVVDFLSAVEGLVKPTVETPAATQAVTSPAVEPMAGISMRYDMGRYKVSMDINGKFHVLDTDSGQQKDITVDEIRQGKTGRAIVVVENDGLLRTGLVGLLKNMQVFEEVAEADTQNAESVINRLKGSYTSVFVLNNSVGVTPAFDIEDLAVIGLEGISILDEVNKKATENTVYARLAIFV